MPKTRLGLVSSEVAIGVSLAVVAVFIAIGLFSDNISNAVSSSKFANIFNNNSAKTKYSAFNREYSNSAQVEVQIMGEQGLELLRKKANNKALDLIQESFSPSNPNGNSIAYLSKIVEAISGQQHICKLMKTDSNEHCDKLDGYEFALNLSGSALLMQKVNAAGTVASQSVSIPVDSAVAAIINAVIIDKDSNEYSTLSSEQIYSIVKSISVKLVDKIRSDAVLVNVNITSFQSPKKIQIDGYSTFDDIDNNIPKKDSIKIFGCAVGFNGKICKGFSNVDRDNIKDWVSDARRNFTNHINSKIKPEEAFAKAINETLSERVLKSANNKDEACDAIIEHISDYIYKNHLDYKKINGLSKNGSRYTISRGRYSCSWNR